MIPHLIGFDALYLAPMVRVVPDTPGTDQLVVLQTNKLNFLILMLIAEH